MSVINATPLLAAAGGDYQISRSVRLRSSASAYFNRTPASAGNRKTWTWSGWVKRGDISTAENPLFTGYTDANNRWYARFEQNTLRFYWNIAATSNEVYTNAVFRDPSAWYHVVVAVDTTQATDSNRIKVYVNGVVQTLSGTYIPQNADTQWNNNVVQTIGKKDTAGTYFDGYMTEVNSIDGQALTPSSFGETNSVTGVWQPKKYTGTYGTNGFYLNFSDNSAATAAAIGKDNSGNGNNWTPNNISVTSGVTYDSMLDVPTLYADGGNGRGNYAVMNPLLGGVNNAVMTNGNLTATLTYSSQVNTYANMPLPTTGKWYWESTVVASNYGVSVGIRSTVNSSLIVAGSTGGYSYYNANGNKYDGATASAYGTSWYGASRTDVIGVAYDADTRELTFYLNGVSQGVAFTVTAGEYYPAASHLSGSGSHTEHYNFGQRPFSYTPPTGFKALNTQNLPEPTIKKGNQYFDATVWTGNATDNRDIVNSGSMQPDLVWVKHRADGSESHWLIDSIRGTDKYISSNRTDSEYTLSNIVQAFNSDGFEVGTDAKVNSSGQPYIGWQWKESPSAGFDIVTYTGTGVARTVAHSLGVAPSMIIVKRRNSTGEWLTYTQMTGNTHFLELNTTAASFASSTAWNNTSPTSSVFSVGTASAVNASGGTYVAYLFAEVAGFSKFGSYTGNGSTDGPFVYLGFRPKFVMVKRTDAVSSWNMFDSGRSINNVTGNLLNANLSDVEYTQPPYMDFLSNGFKVRTNDAGQTAGNENQNGATYIYAAFAENPFKNSLAR